MATGSRFGASIHRRLTTEQMDQVKSEIEGGNRRTRRIAKSRLRRNASAVKHFGALPQPEQLKTETA